MAKKKRKTNNRPAPKPIEYVNVAIPKNSFGENNSVKLTKMGEEFLVSEIPNAKATSSFSTNIEEGIRTATYDASKVESIFDRNVREDSSTYETTLDELSNLAKNTQNDKDKVTKLNGIIQYYMNKEDVIGRVVETVSNNVNTDYSLSFPVLESTKKKDGKKYKEMTEFYDYVCTEQLGLKEEIENIVTTTYLEGNCCVYLRGDANSGYGIVHYPLNMIEVSDLSIDGEPVIFFKVQDLVSKLSSPLSAYGKLKAKSKINFNLDEIVEKQIQDNYPEEVYDAYKAGDQIAILDPARCGIVRVNNYGKKYGVSPVAKGLSSQLMLETLDKVDRNNLIASSKKIYYQLTDGELVKQTAGKKLVFGEEVGYSQTMFVQALKANTTVYTAQPYVKELGILEPNVTTTDSKVLANYRNRLLTALGITFMSADSDSSFTIANMSYEELLRLINRMVRSVENVLNKFFKTIGEDKGWDYNLIPKIDIKDTTLINFENKIKLATVLFGTLGASYETAFDILGLDAKEEARKRKNETDEGYEEVMKPHMTAYNSSTEDTGSSKEDKKDSTNSKVNIKEETTNDTDKVDKQKQDEERNKGIENACMSEQENENEEGSEE